MLEILGSFDAKVWLLICLAVVAAYFGFQFLRAVLRRRGKADTGIAPSGGQLATGFVTNFFDTLGIGSFAPTTSAFKFWRMVPDERIPGTLNVGHTLPVILQTFIYTRIVPVEAPTLILMIGGAVAGAWLGAGVVAGLPRRTIQLGMGGALVAAAGLMVTAQVGLLPTGGEALGLRGPLLGVAVASNFVLGALMTLGIGLCARCMILVSLLGMNPISAFPIMMGSCAFLMPVGSTRFVRKGSFSARAAIGLTVGGLPAILLAAFLVKSLPLTAVRWLVIVVVLYAAIALLRSAHLGRAPAPAAVS